MGAAASPSTEPSWGAGLGGAGPTGEVLAGAGWVGHGQGGLGSGVAGEAPARAEQVGHGRGGPGWAREVGVGCHWRGAGCGSSVRSSWWWRWHTSLYSAWKRCEREREKREKERAGPGILAYVRRADTSADEHKWVDLRGGHGALCSSATQWT
jgi:hypothetical protein